MRFRRTLIAGLLAIATAGLIAAGALAWLLLSTGGARFVLDRAVASAGGAVSIGTIEGRFIDEIVLTDLSYRDAGRAIGVDRVSVRLGLLSLLRGMLVVEDLRSSVIRFQELPSDDAIDEAGAGAFEVPLSVRVDRASIEGVSIARADGSIELERIILTGAVDDTAAYLQRLELRVLGFFVSAQGGIGWQDGLVLDGLVSWSGEIDGDSWLGSADVSGRWPILTIEQEMLAPFEETATGNVLLGDSPAFDLSVELPELGTLAIAGGMDAQSGAWLASIQGSDLRPAAVVPGWPGIWLVDGTFRAELGDGYRIASDDLHLEGLFDERRLDLDLAGTVRDGTELDLRRFRAALGDNRLMASGSIGSSVALILDAELGDLSQIGAIAGREDVQALNGNLRFLEPLTGRATANLAISGDATAPLVSGDVRLDGSMYAGLPLSLSIGFAAPTAGAEAITIERFDAGLGTSRAQGSGQFDAELLTAGRAWRASDAELTLSVDATIDDIQELATLAASDGIRGLIGRELALPAISGRADASLTIEGSPDRLQLAGELRLTDLATDRLDLSEAVLDFEAGLYETGASRLELFAAADAWSARLMADGVTEGSAWSGTLRSLAVDEPWLGSWSLQAPAAVVVRASGIELATACVTHLASGVCVEGRYGSESDRLRVSAEAFELAVLNPLLPPTLTLSGPIMVDARLDSVSGAPRGSLSLSGAGIGIDVALSEADRVTTSLDSVTVAAALDAFALELDASIESGVRGRADVVLSSDDIRDPEAPVSGRLDVSWPDLAALALLSPDVGEVGGNLTIGVDLAGTAANPELGGSGVLRDGRVSVPEWGVLIDRIEGEAVSDAGSSLTYRGSGYVEDSEILVSGVTELDPSRQWPTRLTVSGDDVIVASRPDASVVASPDFDVEISLPRIDVSGTVFVPEASLSIEELPSQAVRVSPDSVVHGMSESELVRPLEVTANVSVELGDNVRYTGSGLMADLEGGLRLEYESGRSPTASGTLMLAGSYAAYGRTLDLERGELLFAGPLDNPALDVLAVRRVGTTTVGVRLSGTLRAPVSTLYSDPAMSDANALSYLMLGRPLSAPDDEETATLQSAAVSLGLQQALPVVQRVGETLGLDELSIEATDIDAGSLMAGKYLNPKLYLSYTYGLFNRLGGFLLRYDINDRFSLETRSGDEKSMDLLYSIEKD